MDNLSYFDKKEQCWWVIQHAPDTFNYVLVKLSRDGGSEEITESSFIHVYELLQAKRKRG